LFAWGAGRHVRLKLITLCAAAAALTCIAMLATARTALADSSQVTTFSETQTIPVPPASAYAGQGGGDGWALALSPTEVFNVFHHSSTLTVACHLQSDATPCWSPETITDGSGNEFATSGHPGLWLDQNTGKLYVYGTRTADLTGGVVCIDTTLAATNPNPFCGFTALTPAGGAAAVGISGISGPALVGSHWYAFNYFSGVAAGASKDQLLCFDTSTLAACAGQPFDLNIGSATVSAGSFPPPAVAAIGSQVIVPVTVGSTDELACFNDSTQAVCSGTWPSALGFNYDSGSGAPFPLLSSTGAILGLCLPTGTDQCFGLDGVSVPTPAGMTGAIPVTSGWNGPAFLLGPRVYVPNGNLDEVDCYDASTTTSCAGFPLALKNLGLLYTVNPDPQRPTCIWVNSDDGGQQIQNFDAFTGQACGTGPIRALTSQFVVNQAKCDPVSYSSIQVVSPAPGTYTSGTVDFADGDGNPLPGVAQQTLDNTGTANLTGLNLNNKIGLPQFLITLNGGGAASSVTVKLTWNATFDPGCVGPTTTVVVPGTPAATPPAGPTAPTVKPTLSGTRKVGQTLTCSKGTVTGNPTSFTYRWYRTGVQVAGANGSTYTLVTGDVGTIMTCQVTASNTAGSATGTSNALYIPLPPVAGCPPATGKMNGRSIGKVSLGMTRNRIRELFSRHDSRGRSFEDFFCLKPIGTRVGYSTPLLLKTLSKKTQKSLKGKVVWASTSNPFYSLDGVRPGQSLKSASKKLGGTEKPFHIGHNDWYLARKGSFTAVLKVRHGEVQEIGIANNALTATRHTQSVLMHSFF
jgi:hypothetical protein